MYSVFTIKELITNNFSYLILLFLSITSLTCAILVITSKNPVISVLYLIGLFFNIACYLILKGIPFIGLSYLLVYVGAVSILFLFILMLINIRVSELSSNSSNSLLLVFSVSFIFINIINPLISRESYSEINEINEVYIATINNWENIPVNISQVHSLGNVLYTVYGIYIIIASIILLLAMVGAIVITIKQRN